MRFAVASRNRAVTGARGGGGAGHAILGNRREIPGSHVHCRPIDIGDVYCPRGLISVTCKRLREKKPSFGPEIFGVIGEHD